MLKYIQLEVEFSVLVNYIRGRGRNEESKKEIVVSYYMDKKNRQNICVLEIWIWILFRDIQFENCEIRK